MRVNRVLLAKRIKHFERLTVLRVEDSTHILCRCQCGKRKIFLVRSVLDKKARSCGCLRAEQLAKRNQLKGKAQGLSHEPEYRIVAGAIARCHDPSNCNYWKYGRKGIRVAKVWRSDPVKFYEYVIQELGSRPSSAHTLDRIDNKCGYKPGNLRWATAAEQNRNYSRNRNYTLKNRTQCLADWAKEYGISFNRLQRVLVRGCSLRRALTKLRVPI